ncbi:tat pathway signal sequence [Apiospora arundinis]|uniref:Tat pathway signal sequence n=1 Tax=Apiospora arundinis TaxID=335852 RepID=A0ABR2HZW4_9PEZI
MPSTTVREEQEKPLAARYDIEYDSEDEESQERRRRRKSSWRESSCCVLSLLIVTSVVSVILGAVLGSHNVDLDKRCSTYTSQYSPVLKDVKIKYGMVSFNGSFKAQTLYRQNASPEVDKAWEALGLDSRAGVIPLSEGPASGLTQHHVQVSEKYGGGYFVNVEGMHHLHCLNLLRKGLWYNYDYYRALGEHAFKNEEAILQLHVSHCLDTLRQVLMCNADTGVLGQVWYNHPEGPQAFPDFQSQHQCKNFEDIKEWAVALQAPPVEELPHDYMKPPRAGDVMPGDM